MKNVITELFNIKYPIIQGGMVWCSGWELVSAVSNAGGLGLIGAGSMHSEVLREHIVKTKQATDKPFGVNVPLLYPEIEKIMDIIISEKVPIVFTSAGNPKIWTKTLQDRGIIVVHVIANSKFALKCEEAGVDAIVAEGFEAGGHNGREETTTMCLIPQIRELIKTPLIAAGGIGSGEAIAAAIALGADAVQIGSLFATSQESSAHVDFKNEVIKTQEGSTKLAFKHKAPVRLMNNSFYKKVLELESNGATVDEFTMLLGKGRARKGIFEGDLVEGELEIGQVSAMIKKIQPVQVIMDKLIEDFNLVIHNIKKCNF